MKDDDRSILEYLSDVQELLDATDYMDDEVLSEAIATVVRCAMNPNIGAGTVSRLIVQFEAWATMAGLQGRSLMILPNGKDPIKRKGFYLSASEKFSRMADALKHMNK